MGTSSSITVNSGQEKIRPLKIFVRILWALAISIEVFFLIYDIPIFDFDPRIQDGRYPEVASLRKKQRDVKVQNFGDLVWLETSPGQRLRLRQNVLTTGNSSAVVDFDEGGELEISENSLVQIERGGSGEGARPFQISLLRGKLKVAGNYASLSVRAGEKEVSLFEGSEVLLKKKKNEALRLSVKSGSASVEGEGETKNLSAGDAALVSDEKTQVLSSSFELISPEDEQTYNVQTKREVLFVWQSRGSKNANGIIEIARDDEFKEILQSQPIRLKEGKNEIQLILKNPGQKRRFYWRIGTTVGVSESEVGEFYLRPLQQVRLIYPEPSTKGELSQDISFNWNALPEAEEYEIQIRTEAGIEKKDTVDGENWEWEPENIGVYNWRVRAKYESGEYSRWSDTRKIEILKKVLPPPPPIDLEEPEFTPFRREGSVFQKIWDFFIPSAAAQDSDSWKVKLSWGEVEDVERYKIQVGRTKAFKVIIDEAITDRAEWTWIYRPGVENTRGRVFYRIASISEDGTRGAFSDPQPIQIPAEILEKARARRLPPKPPPKKTLELRAALHTGYGRQTQSSSESTLQSINLEEGHFQQRIDVEGLLQRGNTGWMGTLSFRAAEFGRSSSHRATTQPDVLGYSFLARAFRLSEDLGYGFVFLRDYRWTKSGPQNVDPNGAFSLGPTLSYESEFDTSQMAFHPEIVDLTVDLPLSGLVLSGAWGPRLRVGSEWRVYSLAPGKKFGLRLEFEGNLSLWKEPSETRLFSWSIWLAPVFHYETLWD